MVSFYKKNNFKFLETIPFNIDSKDKALPFYYSKNLPPSSAGGSKRLRRLAQEVVALNSSLPLTAGSSVFVRASEERLDVMKVILNISTILNFLGTYNWSIRYSVC